MNQRRRNRNKSKSLYVWHRYAGLYAALFVIFLSITGIALNHTDDLNLKKHHINSAALLDLYNVRAPTNIFQFKAGQHTVSQADDFLFINNSRAISIQSPVIGAVEFNDFLVVALTESLLLIDSNNKLIETLSAIDGMPNTISRIGTDKNKRINILANKQIYSLDNDLSLHQTTWNDEINWSKSVSFAPQAETIIIQRYKSNIISWETLMLDIHSGRFFGSYGALFFDFVGIVLLFLASTGVIIWIKQRPENKQ